MLDLLHVEEGLEARSLVFAYVCGGQSAAWSVPSGAKAKRAPVPNVMGGGGVDMAKMAVVVSEQSWQQQQFQQQSWQKG